MGVYLFSGECQSSELKDLQEEYGEWRSQKSPEYSTMVGLNKYNDRLESFAYSEFEKEYVCIHSRIYLKP